jgi:hypothetical protein
MLLTRAGLRLKFALLLLLHTSILLIASKSCDRFQGPTYIILTVFGWVVAATLGAGKLPWHGEPPGKTLGQK